MRASRISLGVFLALFLLSFLLLSVAGDYWPWYAIMACFAILPIIIGPRKYRVFGIAALVLSLALIVMDVVAGRHLQEKVQQLKDQRTTSN
jgi:hypothetical protein